MSMTRAALAAGVALSAVAALSACTGSGDEPATKVTGVASANPTATTSAPSDLTVPASLDPKRLGPGWASQSGLYAPGGLYEPCGDKVAPAAAAVKTFGFKAPAGFTVQVENAKYTKDASVKRAAISAALLNCGSDEKSGSVTTNAILSPIANLDSAGAHVSTEGNGARERSYWAVAKGNLLVSVLVTAPKSGPGAGLTPAVQDAFAARVAAAALAAATGGAYGHISAPDAKDTVVAPNAPAGTQDGPAPVQGGPSGDPTIDVSGPIEGSGGDRGPSGMDGPAPVDGYMTVDPKIDG